MFQVQGGNNYSNRIMQTEEKWAGNEDKGKGVGNADKGIKGGKCR